MHLATGRVTSDVDAIRDPHLLIRPKPPVLEADTDRLEAEIYQRRRATDGQEDLVTFNARAIRQIDSISTVGAGPGVDTRAWTPVRMSTPSRRRAASSTAELRGWSLGLIRSCGDTSTVGTP